MCRVLILDDEEYPADTAKFFIEESGVATADVVNSLNCAISAIQDTKNTGEPYDIFLIDFLLGSGKDGVDAMKELKELSPLSDSIIITGSSDPDVHSRVRSAGAKHYLLKGYKAEELIQIIQSLKIERQSHKELVWQKVFSSMMEAALRETEFPSTAKIVVRKSIKLGFTRAHLFWVPTQEDANKNKLLGITCAGEGCHPDFEGHLYFDWLDLSNSWKSRDVVVFSAKQISKRIQRIKRGDFILPAGETAVLPLWRGDVLMGTLVLDFGNTRRKLISHDRKILNMFARQVAVVMAHASGYSWEQKIRQEEQNDVEKMQVLQRASVEMLRIAQKNEENLWLTVLTVATANFGLGFNRALFFMRTENQRLLRGCAGIGTEQKAKAESDWTKDLQRGYNFDSFLTELLSSSVPKTPFAEDVKRVRFSLDNCRGAVSEVMSGGDMQIVQGNQIREVLPKEITQQFSLATCAVLPVRAGNDVFGIVIVDNKHNGQNLNKRTLARLQTLLDNAGLVWETLRESKKSESLLDANYKILGGAAHGKLKATLGLICKTACQISHADWAVVYPLNADSKYPYQFDIRNVGHHGELTNPNTSIKKTPKVGGVSEYVLQHGMLRIEDIHSNDPMIEILDISSHHFIRDEGVEAMLGVPINDLYTDEPLGILYLDYRRKRHFSERDIHHALCFASLAAVAISDVRRMDEGRRQKRLYTALEVAQVISKEWELEKILGVVLKKLQEHFGNQGIHLGVLEYDKDENVLKFIPETVRFYTKNQDSILAQVFPLKPAKHSSLACKVATKALKSHDVEYLNIDDVSLNNDYLLVNSDTKAELCVSLINSEGALLGVLALERASGVFDKEDITLMKMVARNLGFAFERARDSEEKGFLSTVSAMTAGASDIAHDINNEVGKIRDLAYLIKEFAGENRKICEYAQLVDESAEKLASVGSWRTVPRRELDLDETIKQYIQPLARQRNIKVLDQQLNASGARVLANPMEIQRILRHLVRNADRFMSNLPEKKIDIATHILKDGRVEIIFRDYGPGVDEKVRPTIFRRQVTTKQSSKDNPEEGGGFGLLLTRLLVREMQGTIRLLPNDNNLPGARFSIKLPVVSETSNIE